MKQTLQYNSIKTIAVIGESFAGFNLAFVVPLNRTQAEFDALAAYKAVSGFDAFKDVYVTATVKGQSKDDIRAYDNMKLSDILKDFYKNNNLGETIFTRKSVVIGEELCVRTDVFLPFTVLNLKGKETLEMDIRYNGLTMDAHYGDHAVMGTSTLIVSSKQLVQNQKSIEILEYVPLEDERSKKYVFDGAVKSVAFCQNDGEMFDFESARLSSDLMNSDVTLSDALTSNMSSNKGAATTFKSYLPLFVSSAPLKNLELEITRNDAQNVDAYLLVRKVVLPQTVYKRSLANRQRHFAENSRRLVTR